MRACLRPIISACCCLGGATAQDDKAFAVIGTATPSFPVAAEVVHDVDGNGSDEFVVFGTRGEVRILDPDSGTFRGDLALPHPERSLVAVAQIHGAGPARRPSSLIVFGPDGLHAYPWREGMFRAPGARLLRRGRFTLRVGKPRIANIAQDVNGDGHLDFVLPDHTSCTLYLNRGAAEAGAVPRLERGSRLRLKVSSSASTESDRLSRTLDHSVTVPDIRTLDVNGDGRGDLIAVVERFRHYHIQRDDGTFPADPDVTLDLTLFRDSTPKAEVEFGRTLAQDQALLNSKDLDGDGIPDYVIAHRRKVWVYHGTKERGPQFEKPSRILLLADDVTFLLLAHLDDDGFPDLLAFKLEVPTLATLFLGLFANWDVSIKAVGYANAGGKTFARKPRWRSETTIRVPSIMSLIDDPESIIERFTAVGRKFRHSITGDIDGDGTADVLLQSEDLRRMQFWLMSEKRVDDELLDHRQARELLFEQKDKVWDVDRILTFLDTLAEDRTARLTHGQPAAGSFRLRDPEAFTLEFAAAVDLDGDRRREIVLHYRSRTAPYGSTFDLLRLRR